jgi:flagellar protein FliT
MDQETILASYEAAAEITGQMLAAARASDWDRLSDLESICAREIQRIRMHDSMTALTPLERNRKISAITKILADDREIRVITEPWMAQLSALLRSVRVERKLYRAYSDAQAG